MSSNKFNNKKALRNELEAIVDLDVKYNIPLKNYTSFKIGGPADIFLTPLTAEAVKKSLPVLKKYSVPVFVLGKGSNIIVGDGGFRGAMFYTGKLNGMEIRDDMIYAEGGITLASLASGAMEAGLTGLEFASGIPGSLGGAIYMNAGAYGREMKDVVTDAVLADFTGEEINLSKQGLQFSYRKSILHKRPMVVLGVEIKLKKGSKEKIRKYMKKINQKRREKQPLEWPSAGSTFKRPQGYYAGTLIENAGLKGTRIGDAQISKKHAGFIINLGHATAEDVQQLIKKVQQEVYSQNGVMLEPEPRFIGEFNQ